MRIILANKFFYRRGGDCIYTISLKELLEAHYHEVAIFSMQHSENIETAWRNYFPSEVVFKPSTKIIEAIVRPFGSNEVKKKFNKLIKEFKPDIIHLGNIHSQLSPIIAEIAYKNNIRVVWTMHDYKILCPRYDCLHNSEPCEKCFSDKKYVIKHKCLKGSMAGSILAYLEAIKWPLNKLEKFTNTFICPSQFIANKLISGGVNPDKIKTLSNFIDINKCKVNSYDKDDYYCYVGRLSNEKGLNTLINAASKLSFKLKIIGIGPLMEEIEPVVKNHRQIELMGHLEWSNIKKIVQRARFTVIPSEWYENNPLTVIEIGRAHV